ncbi:NAD(P)-dependent oxidoreductase [Caballeronia sp. INDeC2]|uniref:NAD-dependent epimerase/dehydratase family protein n=1 Tax=Caballeronia sp. INDeC2 TaxID=2921747 RepID=UPI00202843DA|nr:NAD(P)-dependent oxidoreductase [Caballeronia sp. INDeC2]
MPDSNPSLIKTVVLTGAAGRLAQFIRPMLASCAAEVRLCDKVDTEPLFPNERSFSCSLEDSDSVSELLQDATAIVHFAGYPREGDWDVILASNIVPVATLWEEARRARVGRIVYASSNHAVGLYPRSTVLNGTETPKADSRYGISKVFMETVAQYYSDKHCISGFGIRIGHCAEKPTDARMLSHWISPRDLAHMVHLGLTASYQSELVFGVSRNSRSWWNNDRAAELGYCPKDSSDDFYDEVASKTTADPIAEYFQGGSFASFQYENSIP